MNQPLWRRKLELFERLEPLGTPLTKIFRARAGRLSLG
jgi:hypothetical protein